MDIGDNPAGQLGTAYVFSNAQQVRLYKNDVFVTALRRSPWTALPHPPFVMDDTIGELLETQEHFSPAKAAAVRDCLLAAGKYGMPRLPLAYKVKFGWCMLRYKMSFEDGVALYGKYVGNWGGEATRWRFDAVQDGNVVRSVTLCPSAKLHLEVKSSRTALREKILTIWQLSGCGFWTRTAPRPPMHSSRCSLRWRATPPLWAHRPPWQKAA